MFGFTTTITLAILCLAKPSLSRPVPRNEKGELIDINIQLIPGLDIGVNVGCGDNIVDVNLNSMHLPLIPCTNTQKSISTTGVTLPLIGRNMKSKPVDLPTLPNSTGRVKAIDSSIRSLPSTSESTSISISEFIGPITAIDSLIPKSSIVSTSTSIKIDSRPLHTHHPQTLIKRLGTTTKSLTIDSHTAKSISTWISPPQTRFTIIPVNSISGEKTTLVTKASGSSSIRRATWHPPAETLYPPLVEREAPNKGWKRTTRWHPSAESSYPPVVDRGFPNKDW
ncbi:hypothetical protein BCON_0056g00460 [Botryotinia convoluta]|uniref:Uncharacterized protein n=1 Tax=Botryotinia convoluta TaxID=54673 RepID=A0A4Z1ICL6_9HELO|nr:hypothetical protein BCON_0056g00460 [Botryotinia convoluta]